MVLGCLLLVACGDDSDRARGVREDVSPPPGELIYNRFCFSCHAAGTAGAPRAREHEAWGLRLRKGRAALLQSTIQGIAPAMPAMGLCTTCTEAELAAAIDYMLPAQQPPLR